jgi:hypothetical protein
MTDSIEDLVRSIIRHELSKLESSVPVHAPVQDPLRLYSVAAVAELLGVSTDYVYDRIADPP